MSKFKVGDKVKVRADLKINESYGSASNRIIFWPGIMASLKGKTVTIIGITDTGNYETEPGGFILNEEMFEFKADDKQQKIVITTDGKTTTAVLYDGKQRIKEAKAKCAPSDEFDFNIGASIALERLTGQVLGKVESTLDTRPQMDRFIAGEIGLEVPKEKLDKFLEECKKRGLRWRSSNKPTNWKPSHCVKFCTIYNRNDRMVYNNDDHDDGCAFEIWEETEEEVPDVIKSIAAFAAFMKFIKDEPDD